MHGRGGGGGEEGRRSWHMWPVPDTPGAAAAVPPVSPRPVTAPDTHPDRFANGFFLKDGRKIHIGDCALFQSGNSPAFIGLIRSLSSFKEDFPKLIVNWLYRPADIKLAKGILLEAAPNEVFYSFHKDEISAESLLHPCKVAFLRRGVELPSGISSFVCRRVYDIANKCLWWLTDRDYINERQEEVDQLLDKTQIEMHVVVQSGGRSPKQLNGSAPMQQLKSSSDSIQNSSSSGPMHMKGKRRDKVEQNSEAIKRENATKADEGDSGNSVLDGLIRDEVAKITNKGGLVDVTGVDKLISLMQLDKEDRKIDMAGRLLLADVIAATSADRFDCLGRFVQQKGLLVLDDWLQEAHKGKVGDSNSPKEGDKSFEELVLTLLRALDKLPVNLHALQTSNIGKSVNNFRSYKNLEIQKKARILVDTWKKRVDAEIEIMKSNDAKFVGSGQSVSWSGKPGMTEAAHVGSRRMGDAISKISSLPSSTFKNLPVKPCHGDAVSKSVTVSPGSKSTTPVTFPGAICTKDALPKVVVTSSSADLQCTPVKEEKSSGSSQSQNNNQSSVTGPAKTMTASRKEDARSSNSGSLSGSKISGGVSRHRKSSNGLSGAVVSGMQKESSFNKASTGNRTPASNKMPLPGTSEQMLDPPVSEHGNGHRLIVRLPNPGKSPARSTSGCSFEELPVVGSRVSSPCASEKHDQSDLRVTIEGEACQANDVAEPNTEPSNEKKGAVASGEGAHLRIALQKSSDENGKPEDTLKDDNTLPTGKKGLSFSELKSRKQYNPSLCSMNALIESCVKSPETCVSLSAGDDIGMNLLASVATEEILRSELVSSESSVRSLPVFDNGAHTKEDKLNLPHDLVTQGSCQHERMDAETEKTVDAGNFKKESQKAGITVHDDKTNVLMLQEHKITGGHKTYAEKDNKSENRAVIQEEPMLISQEHKVSEVNLDNQMHESHNEGVQTTGGLLDDTHKVRSPLEENRLRFYSLDKVTTASRTESRSLANVHPTAQGLSPNEEAIEDARSRHVDMDVDKTGSMNQNSVSAVAVKQQPPHFAGNDISIPNKAEEFSTSCGTRTSKNDEPLKSKKADCADKSKTEPSENEKELSGAMPPTPGQLCSISVASGNDGGADHLRKKDAPEDASSRLISHEDLARSTSKEGEQCNEPASSNTTLPELNRTGDKKSPSQTSHAALNSAVDVASKLDFDLNEGISADEVSQGEVANVSTLSCSTVACQPLAPNSISTISGGCPVTVTIAAPVKGPFMPPENLSRSKDEPGWKGSAATSAFRPAEPRKALEMPMGRSATPSGGKQNRPSLDIDLNVADARIMEDTVTHCSADRTGPESCSVCLHEEVIRNVGLGLDLNKADESLDGAQNVASTSRRWVPSHSSEVPSGGFLNGETSGPRDFDLNDGPGAETISDSAPQNQQTKSSVLQFLPPLSSLRMNSAESGNLSSWFPSGPTYPAVAISPFFSDRGDNTYPMFAPNAARRFLGSSTVGSSFGGDHYRGAALSSSPAMAFTAANPFTQPGFQFPSGFPLSSTLFTGVSTAYGDSTSRGACLPTLHSPLVVGPANATSSPYIRPYVISLSDSSASGGGSEGARKCGGQNLDLNAGPGVLDVEARADRWTSSSQQMSIANQTVFTEEAGRIYQVSGGGFKRKEPEGGWDTERFSHKQSPWQ